MQVILKNILLIAFLFSTLFVESYVKKVEKFKHMASNKICYLLYDNHSSHNLKENKEQCSKLLYLISKFKDPLKLTVESTLFNNINNKDRNSNYKALQKLKYNNIILDDAEDYYPDPYDTNTYIAWQFPLILNYYKLSEKKSDFKFNNIDLTGLDPRHELDLILSQNNINIELLSKISKKTLIKINNILSSDKIFKKILKNKNLGFHDSLYNIKSRLSTLIYQCKNDDHKGILDSFIGLRDFPLRYSFLMDIYLLKTAYDLLHDKNCNNYMILTGAMHSQNIKELLLFQNYKLIETTSIEESFNQIFNGKKYDIDIFWNNKSLRKALKYYQENQYSKDVNSDRYLEDFKKLIPNTSNFGNYFLSDTEEYYYRELIEDNNIMKYMSINTIFDELKKSITEDNYYITDIILEFNSTNRLKTLKKMNKYILDSNDDYSNKIQNIINLISKIIKIENSCIKSEKQNPYIVLLAIKRLIHKNKHEKLAKILENKKIYKNQINLISKIQNNISHINNYYKELYAKDNHNNIHMNNYKNYNLSKIYGKLARSLESHKKMHSIKKQA